MKMCVLVARYAVSGVPLAQIRLARALAARGHEVDLLVGYVADEYDVPVVEDVNTIVLDSPKVRFLLSDIVTYLANAKPEIVFSAEDHLNAIVLISAILTRSKTKISASSRVTPFDTYSQRLFSKRWLLKQIMRGIMWRADVLSCVSKDMVEQYHQVFGNTRHICIYNIVKTPAAERLMLDQVDHPWFHDRSSPVLVAAGQLGPWKGFTDLIRAVGALSKRRSVRLMLLGDGPQRAELQALIQELGLSEDVALLGHVSNPLKYFAHADAFVLSSLVEGMPNVLIEAMMAGCTPVSTDCPTGPREVLGSGRYGYLVPVGDPQALSSGIEIALDNPIPADVLAEAVRPFEEQTIIDRHFEALGLCSG